MKQYQNKDDNQNNIDQNNNNQNNNKLEIESNNTKKISSIYSSILLDSFPIIYDEALGLGTIDDLKVVLRMEMLPLTNSWQRRVILMEK